MDNYFQNLENRLGNIERILLNIQSETLPKVVSQLGKPQRKVVDLKGLLKHRPEIGSSSTIYKKTHQGIIPHSKQGKKLFFNLEKIDNWLLENKVKTSAEIQAETKAYLQTKKRR